ncbi:flagellar hook-basal body complex protein FliE [Aureimonas phyllosphaerae]|uniref:Flagellar hook-basal body complex protein FliE n=1 Tax=Aureimonas phyllosphaerae TaxID=1166078 RepID=A0A7W6BVP0_9HYPH|nr:flagellar hook-basal body complex protein FliE [Aureimonas phyllosphaerae]MBB3935575.1 flagellar hook-basal body complex protein FliE [Aureimonas phyllosphaerae]MBB3959583.1 flagellar hook-basal body complex protein FliE [Aureimonas phyllosphaerae]SFF12471.1 flagellar hook-basal body complex protein FliE [Aureimonas phyllosphaerae]
MIPAIGSAMPRVDALRLDGLSPAGASSAAATQEAGQSFAAAMNEIAREATQSMKGAETVSIQGVNGKASTQAVVDAVMGAERTLQTAVALRDKVVSAYLELSRMSI